MCVETVQRKKREKKRTTNPKNDRLLPDPKIGKDLDLWFVPKQWIAMDRSTNGWVDVRQVKSALIQSIPER